MRWEWEGESERDRMGSVGGMVYDWFAHCAGKDQLRSLGERCGSAHRVEVADGAERVARLAKNPSVEHLVEV